MVAHIIHYQKGLVVNQCVLEGFMKAGLCTFRWLGISPGFDDGPSQQINITEVLVDAQPYLLGVSNLQTSDFDFGLG